MIELKKMLQL